MQHRRLRIDELGVYGGGTGVPKLGEGEGDEIDPKHS